jgi:hypothetical protein
MPPAPFARRHRQQVATTKPKEEEILEAGRPNRVMAWPQGQVSTWESVRRASNHSAAFEPVKISVANYSAAHFDKGLRFSKSALS